MRFNPLAFASFLGLSITPSFLNMDDDFITSGSRRSRTGRRYPHSSTRQRARYARQIAAGQIRN